MINLQKNEKIVKKGKSNYKKSRINTLGGILCLTNFRLIFEAHNFNFGGKTVIDLSLNQLVRCQSGKINLFSGEIEVFDRYQNKYVFIVYDRKGWADTIEKEIIKYKNIEQNYLNTKIMDLNQDDTFDKIKKIKELYDAGILSEEEYKNKKIQLLEKI